MGLGRVLRILILCFKEFPTLKNRMWLMLVFDILTSIINRNLIISDPILRVLLFNGPYFTGY